MTLCASAGCKLSAMTSGEARASLEESAVASQAEALTSAGIEIATSFTLGEAVTRAAGEIRDLVGSQLPCAEVTVAEGTLSIEYGVREGNCEQSRHVVHELTWTRLADGKMGVGSGNRTQTPLPEGIAVGFQVDGMRAWEGERGRWELAIENVQMRWVDPAPQAGRYVLDTPFDKSITLEFERIDESSIGVTAKSGQRSVRLRINRLGLVSRQ
jgi:hypothetical protein